MSDTSSSHQPPLDVQEVRRGLFRIRWDIEDDIRDGPLKETFQLRGFQSGQSYIISCYPKQQRCASRGGRRDRLPFTVRLSLKKYDDGRAAHSGLNWLIQQPEEESQQQLPRPSASRSKVLESLLCPAFVWVSSEDENQIQLAQSDSGTWRLSTYDVWKQQARIVLWMDFGTKTAGEKTITDGLSQLFTEQIECDVQFQFDGQETVGAHVSILSAGSPVFAAMFRSGMEEAQTRRVTIGNIERNVFCQLITYLYTGSCPKVEDENMTQLLFEAADMYDVETLKYECVDILLTRLAVDNAVDSLIWAQVHSIPKLFEATMEFVSNHGRQLCFRPEWASLMKNFPDLCLAATQRIVGLLTTPDSEESEMNLDWFVIYFFVFRSLSRNIWILCWNDIFVFLFCSFVSL